MIERKPSGFLFCFPPNQPMGRIILLQNRATSFDLLKALLHCGESNFEEGWVIAHERLLKVQP
jgi:hypothetical protein